MTHGAPDNFQVQPRNIVYVLQDDAELAVRLGAISSIDRLGNILFFDDFSNGKEAWVSLNDGTLSNVSITTTQFKHGGFSCKLTGGSDDLKLAGLAKNFSYPDPSKMGMEFNFSIDDNVDYILFRIGLYSLTTKYNAYIKLDLTNAKLQYLGSDNNYHDFITSLVIEKEDYFFHSMKIVGDFITGKYVRAIFDGISYNLSDYSMYKWTIAYNTYLEVNFNIYSKNGVNGIVYLDSIILTRDEP